MSKMVYYFLYIFLFQVFSSLLSINYKEVKNILDSLDTMDRKTPPEQIPGGVLCY